MSSSPIARRLRLDCSWTCAPDQAIYIRRLQAHIKRLQRRIERVQRDIRRVQPYRGRLHPHIRRQQRRISRVHADIGRLHTVIWRPPRDIRRLQRCIDRLQARIRRLQADKPRSSSSISRWTATRVVGNADSEPLKADPWHRCSITHTQEVA